MFEGFAVKKIQFLVKSLQNCKLEGEKYFFSLKKLLGHRITNAECYTKVSYPLIRFKKFPTKSYNTKNFKMCNSGKSQQSHGYLFSNEVIGCLKIRLLYIIVHTYIFFFEVGKPAMCAPCFLIHYLCDVFSHYLLIRHSFSPKYLFKTTLPGTELRTARHRAQAISAQPAQRANPQPPIYGRFKGTVQRDGSGRK